MRTSLKIYFSKAYKYIKYTRYTFLLYAIFDNNNYFLTSVN